MQEHVAEFGIGDAHFGVLDPLFYGFFAEHIIDGDISSHRTEEFEEAHILIEIIVIDHFEFEIISADGLEIFEDLFHLFGDGFFVVSKRLLIEHYSVACFETRVTDHSRSSSNDHDERVAPFHEIDCCHEADEVS